MIAGWAKRWAFDRSRSEQTGPWPSELKLHATALDFLFSLSTAPIYSRLTRQVALSEEEPIYVGAVNSHVTGSAILVSQQRLVVEVGCIRRTDFVRIAMTLKTQLLHARSRQQFRVR